jgi:DNA-binding transcriptional ArsR family regulator
MQGTHTPKSNGAGTVRTASEGPNVGLRNERKRRILSALEGRGWMTAAMVASLAQMPRKAVYKPLNRYRRWGLVCRREQGGLWLYALSERGWARLAWLSGRASS